ncbi:MAG: zinc-ribbon domain-containing protein [Luteitalea sp.]|nr:zinc-ribbon domain-containing protein [Luteitalea sp.]
MFCSNCGTEIADKALICYKCGRATFEPLRKPPAPRATLGPLLSVLALMALTLAALFLGATDTDRVPTWVPWVIGGVAFLLLLWRVLRLRR